MSGIPLTWLIFFNLFVVVMLALDLWVFHGKAHVVLLKEALGWFTVWIAPEYKQPRYDLSPVTN